MVFIGQWRKTRIPHKEINGYKDPPLFSLGTDPLLKCQIVQESWELTDLETGIRSFGVENDASGEGW